MYKDSVEKERLIEVNRLLIKGRWLYISLIAFIGLFSKITGTSNVNFPTYQMLLMIGTGYILNLIYALYFYQAKTLKITSIRIVSFLQLTLDQIFFIVVIFYAGGVTSISFLWFFYLIIASAFFYSLGGVVLISSIASVLYGSLITLQYYKIIPFFPRYNLPYEEALAFNLNVVAVKLAAVIGSFYVVGIFAGIIAHRLRKNEHDLRTERDKEKAILSNLIDGLVYISHDGRIELVNPRAEKLLHFKSRSVVGKYINKLNPKKFNNLISLYNSNVDTLDFTPAGEADVHVRVHAVEIRDRKRQLIGTAKILYDISREKFIDKMKSEFIMLAGHQLRTPLSAIKFALSLFIEEDFGKVNKEQKKVLEQCFSYNERLIELINDMLNVYSAEEGRFYYQYSRLDLKQLLHEITRREKLEPENRNKEFELDIDDAVPKIDADPYKLKLALGSIIDNAFRYTPSGGLIKVGVETEAKEILIKIKDTGIGIPDELQLKVFSKFFRADNAISLQPEGNGLDLFVAKRIIEGHGGKIWFKSKVKQGTTFYISLPLKPTHTAKE